MGEVPMGPDLLLRAGGSVGDARVGTLGVGALSLAWPLVVELGFGVAQASDCGRSQVVGTALAGLGLTPDRSPTRSSGSCWADLVDPS